MSVISLRYRTVLIGMFICFQVNIGLNTSVPISSTTAPNHTTTFKSSGDKINRVTTGTNSSSTSAASSSSTISTISQNNAVVETKLNSTATNSSLGFTGNSSVNASKVTPASTLTTLKSTPGTTEVSYAYDGIEAVAGASIVLISFIIIMVVAFLARFERHREKVEPKNVYGQQEKMTYTQPVAEKSTNL